MSDPKPNNDSNPQSAVRNPQSTKAARRYIVRGRVQGVGFRWYVERVAASLGLAGYVKNQYNGDVEVYAIGAPEALDAMRRSLERGPRGARVTEVRESPAAFEDCRSFRIAF